MAAKLPSLYRAVDIPVSYRYVRSHARKESECGGFQRVAMRLLAAVRPANNACFLVWVSPRLDKSLKMRTMGVRAKLISNILERIESDHLPKFCNGSTFPKHRKIRTANHFQRTRSACSFLGVK